MEMHQKAFDAMPWWRQKDLRKRTAAWLPETVEPAEWPAFFIERGVAVFAVGLPKYYSLGDDSPVVVNPVLKDAGFHRVLDPYTCYQELAMFVGGVLTRPEAPTLTVTEKDRMRQHGFDYTYGFRTRPK